jgi:uncharacterized protein YjbI with pentapeptide repeats
MYCLLVTRHSFNKVAITASSFDHLDASDSCFNSTITTSSSFISPSFERVKLSACKFKVRLLISPSIPTQSLTNTYFKECDLKCALMHSTHWHECQLDHCKMTACDMRSSVFKACVISNVDWGLHGKDACDLKGATFVNTAVDAAVADATLVMHYPAVATAAEY